MIRAVSHMQRQTDVQTSVARRSATRGPAVRLTFAAETRSMVRVEYRRVIAVLLPRRGAAAVLVEPAHWLALWLWRKSEPVSLASHAWRDRSSTGSRGADQRRSDRSRGDAPRCSGNAQQVPRDQRPRRH